MNSGKFGRQQKFSAWHSGASKCNPGTEQRWTAGNLKCSVERKRIENARGSLVRLSWHKNVQFITHLCLKSEKGASHFNKLFVHFYTGTFLILFYSSLSVSPPLAKYVKSFGQRALIFNTFLSHLNLFSAFNHLLLKAKLLPFTNKETLPMLLPSIQ